MGLAWPAELGRHYRWSDVCEECDITLDPLFDPSEVACYASWPLQAYIKGFPLSHSLSLTYTYNDACLLYAFSAPLSPSGTASPLFETVHYITLKVSGGTVKSTVV